MWEPKHCGLIENVHYTIGHMVEESAFNMLGAGRVDCENLAAPLLRLGHLTGIGGQMEATGEARSFGVASVTLDTAGGGIAYASRLVTEAISRLFGRPWTTAVDPAGYMTTTVTERAAFAARIAFSQLSKRVDAMVYTHHHIAVVQNYLPRPFRVPYAVMLHDRGAWDPAMTPRRRASIAHATLRIANSVRTARLVAEAHPALGEIVVCHLGLLPDNGELPGDRKMVNPKPLVIIVGRMWTADRHKGHDLLLDVWHEVLRVVPDAHLAIVGEGDDRSRLEQKSMSLSLSSHVTFMGFLSDRDLQRALRTSSVFAMPSGDEGFGLVYLEAMRAGLPCIAGNSDAAQEVVVDGKTGLLVAPGSKPALVEAIVRLLQNEPMRSAMGRAGYERFDQTFKFDRYLARMAPILADLCALQIRSK